MRLERISLPVESDVLVLGDEVHLDKSTNSLDSADRAARSEDGTLQQATWRWDGSAVEEPGQIVPEQDVELTLADGSTKTKTTNGSGTVELNEIPPGPVKVKFPELGAPDEEAEAGEAPQNSVSVRAGPGRPPDSVTVATGRPYRIRVAREKGLATL